MVVRPATVQGRLDAIGRDIYGQGSADERSSPWPRPVQQGDSGGPFVTSDGLVAGVVFAGDPGRRRNGYALSPSRSAPASTRPSRLTSRPSSAPAATDYRPENEESTGRGVRGWSAA